jgi:hypothetical protein
MRNQSEFRVFKTQWTADKQSRLAPEQISDTTWVFIILYKNIFKFQKHNGAQLQKRKQTVLIPGQQPRLTQTSVECQTTLIFDHGNSRIEHSRCKAALTVIGDECKYTIMMVIDEIAEV